MYRPFRLISAILVLSVSLFAQTLELKDKTGKTLPNVEVKHVETVEKGRYFLPDANPKQTVDLSPLVMADADGKLIQLQVKNMVTVIEYWTEEALENNQYWNRMRELEVKYQDNPRVQLLSINYEPALSGKAQIKKIQERIKKMTPPRKLIFDLMDGLADIIKTPGPVAYILIDGRGQYTYVGRGDDCSTDKVFDNIDNAILYLDHVSKKNTN